LVKSTHTPSLNSAKERVCINYIHFLKNFKKNRSFARIFALTRAEPAKDQVMKQKKANRNLQIEGDKKWTAKEIKEWAL
jgi:hypothetical protein